MSIDHSIVRRDALKGSEIAQFERMLEIRGFEERLNVLFSQGEIHGTTHLAIGQEALAVGIAAELHPTDWVTATYRGHAMALALGMPPSTVLAEIMGKAEGSTGGLGGSMHLSDISVGLLPTFAIVGAGLPVAVGVALAYQSRGESSVAVAVFGDGATNIGAFHESLNLAAIWNLPVVFVCDNNVYGEYSRIDVTTPIEDLHERASAYGMPSQKVDGMRISTVRAAVAQAVERARGGGGPTLIEAKTYRFAGHSRADTATYRPAGELDQWSLRDPLRLAHEDLVGRHLATQSNLDELKSQTEIELNRVVEAVLGAAEPTFADMFTHVWAKEAEEEQA